MTLNIAMKRLRSVCAGYWGERICAELHYIRELSKISGGRHDDQLLKAAETLLASAAERGVVTREAAETTEASLSTAAAEAKRLTAHAVGHAHIDMNWMWRYDETVNITLETFRTALRLMEDFEEFTFSQSQASCYRIVERYDKKLLERIREKVKAGRWEVAASTWVETDKNMPGGESLARHILYTKRYMNRLFGLPEDALRLDFEPDTFGHNGNVPEILAAGGVDFYYFCRGYEAHEIFNWRAPSGAQILAYREPFWYIKTMEPDFFVNAPAFCHRNGVSDILMVYGVGDHGGGPTRRDLERIVDMSAWPLFPKIIFSTYHRFFDAIKPLRATFPTVEGELNFLLTGCYTTQSRIKAANRIAEAALFEAEALAALTPAAAVDFACFEDAWRDVLFNQFHDIIPGSGVIDTREHARGLFQEALANANAQKGIACYAICDRVDTSAIGTEEPGAAVSEGAGVGYAVEGGHGLARVERGRGVRRGYLLFNTAGAREDAAELTIWDWTGDLKALRVTGISGERLPFQILEENKPYWGHKRTDLLVHCGVPAMGWRLLLVDEDDCELAPYAVATAPRVQYPYEYALENEILRAVIDPAGGFIREIVDKRTGAVTATNAGFSGLTESAHGSMTAWVVARYKNDETPIAVDQMEWTHKGPLRSAVKATGHYKDSRITYTYSLDRGAEYVAVSAQVDWLEHGTPDKGVPQLRFIAEHASGTDTYLYDIPFGSVKRPPMDMDVPGLSYACSQPARGPALAILSRDKYGYRCADGKLSLTLIRSACDPDPFPELYRHDFTLYLAVPGEATAAHMGALSEKLCHPVFAQSVAAHGGTLPAAHSLLDCDAALSGVKLAEDGSGDIVVRIYDDTGEGREAHVALTAGVASARLCSLTELPGEALCVSGNIVTVPLRKNGLATVRLTPV